MCEIETDGQVATISAATWLKRPAAGWGSSILP
jgi:hypothetical protein